MSEKYYPWDGEFTECDPNSCVAVVLLNIDYKPSDKVAIYGPLKTENIGVEKIVANTISNPNIRYLVICGEEIRGHRSGSSLVSLNKNGVDNKNRIINAPGAIPYIENLDDKAIKRFQKQIEIIDMVDIKDTRIIDKEIKDCLNKSPETFGKPFIALKLEKEKKSIGDKRALHSRIMINYLGKIKKRGE